MALNKLHLRSALASTSTSQHVVHSSHIFRGTSNHDPRGWRKGNILGCVRKTLSVLQCLLRVQQHFPRLTTMHIPAWVVLAIGLRTTFPSCSSHYADSASDDGDRTRFHRVLHARRLDRLKESLDPRGDHRKKLLEEYEAFIARNGIILNSDYEERRRSHTNDEIATDRMRRRREWRAAGERRVFGVDDLFATPAEDRLLWQKLAINELAGSFVPSPRPTPRPTPKVTLRPTPRPTKQPVRQTPRPTRKVSFGPTRRPSPIPTPQPSPQPTRRPTKQPVRQTPRPTRKVTLRPTRRPSPRPTPQPSQLPTRRPTKQPVRIPRPSEAPVARTPMPSEKPVQTPRPSPQPIQPPTVKPVFPETALPTSAPSTVQPSRAPVDAILPTKAPATSSPSEMPTSDEPTIAPVQQGTAQPSRFPRSRPPRTRRPASRPTRAPTSRSRVAELIRSVALFGGSEFSDNSTYQSKSLNWLENSSTENLSDERIIQRYSLGCIYYATFEVETIFTIDLFGEGGVLPWRDSTNWVTDENECLWARLGCNEDNNVVVLDLVSTSTDY